MSTFFQDLRFAFRTLRKHWLVTVAAVLSLALAIGGNAAVFSMVDAFLFRPLPERTDSNLRRVGSHSERDSLHAG
jgi:hypothetical protein